MSWYKITMPGFPAPAHQELVGDLTALAACPALGAVSLLIEPRAVDEGSTYYFYAEKPDAVGWFITRYNGERCPWPDTTKLRTVATSEEP